MLVPLSAGDASLLLPLALALTMLVGLLQTGLAVARLGTLANFISPSVMLGFTTGAAALIAWYALAGLMGAAGRASPLQAWQQGVAPAALAVGGVTLVAALAGRRWWRRGPYLLVALLLGIGIGWWLTQQPLPGPVPLRWSRPAGRAAMLPSTSRPPPSAPCRLRGSCQPRRRRQRRRWLRRSRRASRCCPRKTAPCRFPCW